MFLTQNIFSRTKMPACQHWFPETSGQDEHFDICQRMTYRRLDPLEKIFFFCCSTISKICFKMVKAITPNTTDQNILFLNKRIPFNLHCRFNECGIELLFLINYLWINFVRTRHPRPWYSKQKKSEDDSSQKIGRNMYTQGTVMH